MDYGYLSIVKTDQDGAREWGESFCPYSVSGSMRGCQGRSIQQTSDGGYIVAGFYSYLGFGEQYAIISKRDQNGDEEWIQLFETNNPYAYKIEEIFDPDSQEISGYGVIGKKSNDFWFLRMDLQGNVVINNTYNYAVPYHWADNLTGHQTNDGGFIMVGGSRIIKIDYNGEEEWSQSFSSNSFSSSSLSLNSIIQSIFPSLTDTFLTIPRATMFSPASSLTTCPRRCKA